MKRIENNNNSQYSVAQIGCYSAGCGGVQGHISRLHKMLTLSGIPCRVYCPHQNNVDWGDDIRPVRSPWWARSHLHYWGYHWFLQYGFGCEETIIHCHEQWKMATSMLGMVLANKKIVMTIHDQMLDLRWKTILPIDRAASKLLIKSKHVWWIAVSEAVRSQLVSLGVPPERISVIPAFIPPLLNDLAEGDIPTNVREFVEHRSPLISTYGWMLVFSSEGTDLHSFDHCIELIRELKADFPTIGLIICMASVNNYDYLEELKQRIRDFGLETNILLLTEPLKEGHLLWKCSDLYLRATTTDGDAVSIREALSLSVPVVASDASVRPEGTVIFKTRNLISMIQAVRSVLNDRDYFVKTLHQIEPLDTFPIILKLYQQVMES